eukprot:COSAG01_NODE_3916_length_5541_cov_12.214994_4_plen_61_part_00
MCREQEVGWARASEQRANPIEHYWFDVEPSYIERNRSRGQRSDRCEFGIVDARGETFMSS